MSEIENAADPTQVKDRQSKEKHKNEQQQADLKWLLEQPQFRRFIWRLVCEECQAVGKSAFSTNGSVQSYNLGMQAIGCSIWSQIESVDASAIPKMMLEYLESQQ